MKVHVRHEWGSWNNIADDIFKEIYKRYEYVPHNRMYDCDVYVTWQDVMGCEAPGAKVRNIPLITVQHGAHAQVDFLPEISYPPISDHYCVWGKGDARWLNLAGVQNNRIEITGTPVINNLHARNREDDRKFWLDYAGVSDRPIILYGPDHATHVGTYDKNIHIMKEIVELAKGPLSHCLFIVKIFKESIQGYREFLQDEHNRTTDPYDWLDDMNPMLNRPLPAWIDTIEGKRQIKEGILDSYIGIGDVKNIIFTCGHWFPQEMLFSSADVCIVGSVATFAVKAFSANIPVIVPGKRITREETHSFKVHGKKPYFLYTDNALELDAIECPEIDKLEKSIKNALLNPDVHSDGRHIYTQLHAGPKDGAVKNIINIIERYNK